MSILTDTQRTDLIQAGARVERRGGTGISTVTEILSVIDNPAYDPTQKAQLIDTLGRELRKRNDTAFILTHRMLNTTELITRLTCAARTAKTNTERNL